MRRVPFPLAAVLCCFLAACAVGPDYETPATAMPATWAGLSQPPTSQPPTSQPPTSQPPTSQPAASQPAASQPAASQPSVAVSGPADVATWWTTLNDAQLTRLIEQAAAANLDLVQAQARIQQARASQGIAQGALLPTLDASASGTRSGAATTTGSGTRIRTTGNQFRAGFDAAWEIDVFGGLRRSVEVAEAGVLAAVESRRDLLVSLAGEVATVYLQLRGAQEQLRIARRNLEAQQQTLVLTQERFEAGFVSALDVAQSRSQVAATASRIPTLEGTIRVAMYALGVLLGQEPAALVGELGDDRPIPVAPVTVPIGLPSELLQRRPDVRRVEAELHAATARVGVATADLYPKFSLSGSFGTQGRQVDDLGSLANRFWSITPAISWPLFAGGRIRANIALQKAAVEETVALYRQTILIALRDVETALVAFSKDQERRAALIEAVAATRQAVELSMQLYSAGRTDFLNVLTAQRAQFDAEDALSQSQTAIATDLVALYKALGGGWDVGAAE